MNVEIVTIGDELLLGFTIDTNGAHLSRELAALGVAVTRRVSVADEADAIVAAVGEGLARTGAVITTGGLGPTSDDRSKEAVAALFGRGMRLDEPTLESLRARWKARGWPGELPVSNARQAEVPEGSELLTNRHGAAPGIWIEDAQGRWVAMLPGVPREMRGMAAEELVPRVAARAAAAAAAAGTVPAVIRSRTLRTTGIAESALADLLGPLARDPEGCALAYLPGWEGVDLRLTVRGVAADAADAMLARGVAALRQRMGQHIYGEGKTDLAEAMLEALRERGWRLAVAESCTGGMLGSRLTAVPGSSDVVLGGIIAYHNDVKVVELGVRTHTLETVGAVSEETAREMASGVRAKLGGDVGIGITGVAGPGGGTPDKPVGTVCLAVDVAGGVHAVRTTMIGDRDEIRRRATQGALALLRRVLAR